MASSKFLREAYMAYFGRPVDTTGARDFANATEAQVEAAFSASPESIELFGPTFNASQINFIYLLLFNRPAETAGILYWLNEVARGALTPTGAAIGILHGAQNSDLVSVTNKLTTSGIFTDSLGADGPKYAGTAAAEAARDYIRTVTTTVPSQAAIDAAIDTVVSALPPGIYSLTADAPFIIEGDAGTKALTFVVTLDRAPTSAVTVNYQTTASGTATSGDDFAVAASTVTFAAGQKATTVTILVNGDTVVEGNETVSVSFSGSSLTAPHTATGTINNDDIVLSGQSFNLTPGTDNIPGLLGSNGTTSTLGDNVISAVIENSGTNGATNLSTLNSTDSINAGEGSDVLNVRVTSLTGAVNLKPVLTSVEKISITNTTASTTQVTIDLLSAPDVSTVEFKETSERSITNVLNASATARIVFDHADSSSIGHRVNLGSAAGRTGTADAFSLTIANGSGTGVILGTDVRVPAGLQLVNSTNSAADTSFEIANITNEGAANFLELQSSFSTLKTVSVTGDATGVTSGFALTLTQTGNFASLSTVSASSLTGGGLSIDARGSGATGFAFTGSGQADRVVLASTAINNTNAGALNGGGGKDILGVGSFKTLTAAKVNSATGFEVLELVDGGNSSLKANDFTSINEFLFSAQTSNGDRLSITGVQSNDRFVFASDLGNGDETVRFTGANAGNTVLFEMRASSVTDGEVVIRANTTTGSDVSAIGFQGGISGVTIDSTGSNAKANLIEAVDTGSENYFAFNNDGFANFTITGSQNLTIAAKEGIEISSSSDTAGFKNAANVNASGFTGSLRIAGSGTDDVITGGSGNDVFYGLAGADVLTGNGGADQFRLTGNTQTDLIMDFVNGTDKVGFNFVNFGNTEDTSAGATLSSSDYIENRAGITSIGGSDDRTMVELTSAASTSQIQTDKGAAVEAVVLVFNSTTGRGELWFDNDWSDTGDRSQLATFDNVITLVGVTAFTNTDFVEFDNS